MKHGIRESVRNHIRTVGAREIANSYLQILLGCVIGAAAYPAFLVPNSIAPGGLTGVATILNHLFGLPVGTVSLLLNIPLFIIGYRSMGKVFAFRSLIATCGVVLGAGLGLILRGGATTGGTDMVARMVHRRLPFISVGMFLFGLDCLVVLGAAAAIGTEQALYAFINIYVCSRVIDAVMMGFSGNKACFIMTSRWEEITKRLMDEVGRGVTHLSAKGAYTGTQQPVVLCVAARQEIMSVKRIVEEEDEKAFMFISEAHEALGEGFSRLDSRD